MTQSLLMDRCSVTQRLEELQLEYFVTNGSRDVKLDICQMFLEQCRIDEELLSLIPDSCDTAFVIN